MHLYRYEHECGYHGEQMLKADKDSVVLSCVRCGRGVTARQVRNKAMQVSVNDWGVNGVFVRDGNGS